MVSSYLKDVNIEMIYFSLNLFHVVLRCYFLQYKCALLFWDARDTKLFETDCTNLIKLVLFMALCGPSEQIIKVFTSENKNTFKSPSQSNAS